MAVHDTDANDDISDSQKGMIRCQCRYILIALMNARKEMGKSGNRPKWKECTAYDVRLMEAVGQGYIKHAETVQECHMLLKDSGDRFAHPNPLIVVGKIPEPLFFYEKS